MTLTPTRRGTLAAGITMGTIGALTTLAGCRSAVSSGGGSDSQTPRDGGTLTIAQSVDISPDNLLAGRLGNAAFAANVFETVTVFDAERTPQPLLAKEWDLAEDQTSISLTLRDDVTFHSGRPLVAEDVKFSFEQSADSAAQVGYIAKKFDKIEVTDERTLKIKFSEPLPNIFDFFEQTFILDSESADGLADGSRVIGTGPFRFGSWNAGSAITLTRNDGHWAGKPHLDQIDIAVITDSTAMLNAVRSDRSQVAIGMNSQDLQALDGSPGIGVVTTAGSIYPLGVDVEDGPFDSQEVRQAVQYAVDRSRIAEQVFGAPATPSALPWPLDTPGFPSDLQDHFDYDPDRARSLLAKADAAGAKVTLSVISIPSNTSVAEVVRSNLEDVGLVPTIKAVDNQTFGQKQIAGDLGQMFMPLHGLNGLAPITLIDTLPSLRKGNSSHFWTDEYVGLRDALLTSSDDDYEAALHELSEFILDQAFTANLVHVEGQIVAADSARELIWTSRGYLDARAAYVTE